MHHTPSPLYRFCEILPGLLTWTILLLPWILLFVAPLFSLGFILLYIVLWFLRSLYFSFCLIRTYLFFRHYEQLPWRTILHESFYGSLSNLSLQAQDKQRFTQALTALKKREPNHPLPEDVYHAIIIATYKEEYPILEETIRALADADYDSQKLIVILACEERDEVRATANATKLLAAFDGMFHSMHWYLHPKDIPGEIPGKGGNISFSGEQLATYITEETTIRPEQVVVTTLDADHKVHKDYFSVLTYTYLVTPVRSRKTYQPLPLFYNNIWEVPLFNRLVAMSSSFWHLIESGRPEHLRNFASQAQPLDALIAMNFWSRTSIVEDGHQFWRAYFHFKGDHQVIPLFIPIYQDAVQNSTYITTLKGQYLQLRRWAYGASDIAYVITTALTHWKELPRMHTLSVTYYLIQGHVLWATSAIILTMVGPLQQAITFLGESTVMQSNLARILSFMFTVALSGIFISMLISFLTIPAPKDRSWLPKILHTLQWLLLPVITLVYGAIPAIDAQTRLMLGKYLHFNVTQKVRKK